MASSPPGHVSLTNRCRDSKSPYVRAHMDNPTAWQLWNAETLALARKTNRPLFVSIGYSACHWCHVMAHESFDDPRIAQLLNEHFIPVKIDREERPDIDRQYMDFLQATTGAGGWPLNVFVTPDLEPVLGGTYWPGPKTKRALAGGGSFEDVLTKVAQAWKEQEKSIRESGSQIARQLREFAQEGSLGGRQANGDIGDGEQDGLELDLLEESYQHYKQRFDTQYGGFGGAPKFPTPIHIGQMLRLNSYGSDVREIVGEDECQDAQQMALKTLTFMYKGGIKDQVGHGFARYSVTRDWNLPHFEKMLYDNAQLLPLYLDAWLLTNDPLYLEATMDIATYLTSKPMLSPLGAIHASEDADSLPTAADKEKREGAFYVYSVDEIQRVLSAQEADVITRYWGLQAAGNIDPQFDAQGELKGQNTLCVQMTPNELATELELPETKVNDLLKSSRQKLLAYRDSNRPRPALDDKIVTAWNGLAISGLARTAAALASSHPSESADYLSAAIGAAECIRNHLYQPSTKTLLRVYRDGPGSTPGFADDYAFLISGLIDLYTATFDASWLRWATDLQESQTSLFWDTHKHGFFSTAADQPDILVRTKDGMDNAEPSVNGVAAHNLHCLGSLLDDAGYAKMARRTVAAFEVEISQHPGLFSGMMPSIVAAKSSMQGLVVAGKGGVADKAVQAVRRGVRPTCTILRIGSDIKETEWLRQRNQLVKDLDAEKEFVQLCEGSSCKVLDGAGVDDFFKSA
ncbi:hypothetical protein WHR41_06939 [Cladosporium halotolerans]|uniref:Spermatogenesis-associated protein 20-like TRX domain-containing protein n=1 Tax=Cladosporium halotolerans TaxID=1052096 RepID=A0AB34KNY6_9PEZI